MTLGADHNMDGFGDGWDGFTLGTTHIRAIRTSRIVNLSISSRSLRSYPSSLHSSFTHILATKPYYLLPRTLIRRINLNMNLTIVVVIYHPSSTIWIRAMACINQGPEPVETNIPIEIESRVNINPKENRRG
jgi:hypothetical protein